MKAARLASYGESLEIMDAPEPKILEPNDVIVRIGGAGLCSSDLEIMEGSMKDFFTVSLPYTIGHENAGWVEEVGSGVTTFAIGDPVVAIPIVPCGKCLTCRSGNPIYCTNSRFPGADSDGGMASHFRTSEWSLIKLPPGVEPKDIAPQADAGITAYRAVKKAVTILHPGTKVVVIGIGGLGHIAVQALKAMCSAEIISIDTAPGALEMAREFGSDYVIDAKENPVETVKEITEGKGVEAVIDFVGETHVIKQAFDMLGLGGTYYAVGNIGAGVVHIPIPQLLMKEASIVATRIGTYAEMVELVTLVAQGKVVGRTKTYPLSDVNKAIDDLRNGRIRGRGVLIP